MKVCFTTVRGSVSLEKELLVIRNLVPPNRNDQYWVLLHMIFFVYVIEKGSKLAPLAWILLGFLGLYFLVLLGRLLFFTVWRDRIPLGEIRSVRILPGEFPQLETRVRIELRNRRIKTIRFRTGEGQHEAFVEWLFTHQSNMQPA